jgi:hypothetical protein
VRTKFLLETLKQRDNSEDLGVDVMIILKWISWKIGLEDVDWTHLAQNRDR